MRVGIYAGAHHPIAPALAEGFRLCGVGASVRASDLHYGEREKFDLVVVYGMRAGRRVRQTYAPAGAPVVVCDWGYLARVSSPEEHHLGHFQVGMGSLNHPPRFECPEDRFQALGLDLVERGGDPNGYVLVCGQVPGDAAHGMNADALQAWLVEKLMQYPGAVYRPHPRGGIDLPGVESDRRPLAEALAGARLVVTINSNVGHEALLAGVPVVCGPGAAYEELAGEELPSITARRAYFARLAYGQWTLGEMRTGACQRFVIEHLLPGVGPALEGERPGSATESVPTGGFVHVPAAESSLGALALAAAGADNEISAGTLREAAAQAAVEAEAAAMEAEKSADRAEAAAATAGPKRRGRPRKQPEA